MLLNCCILFASIVGHLCGGVQFDALRNLYGSFPIPQPFSFKQNFSILFIGSPLIVTVSFAEISASGIVFFLFFLSHVFCFIISFFFQLQCFSLIILSRSCLSVIAVIYLDISNSSPETVLKLDFLNLGQSSPGFAG